MSDTELLQARLDAVAAIHRQEGDLPSGYAGWCIECGHDGFAAPWPCPTYRAAFPDGMADAPVSPRGHNAKTPAAL